MPASSPASSSAQHRLVPVSQRAARLRLLFEVEKQFALTVCTVIYRVGEPELKYRLCEHAWEAIEHARFLHERGRELPGFGKSHEVRPEIVRVFDEAVLVPGGLQSLAAFYRVLKPAMADAYRAYVQSAGTLGDLPTTKLIEQFLADETRHAIEMESHLAGIEAAQAESHVRSALDSLGGWLQEREPVRLPRKFVWLSDTQKHALPARPERRPYPTASSSYGDDPAVYPIVPAFVEDPTTDARVIRAMIYIWLYLELDAVDYRATVPYGTPDMPLEFHADLIRHLWDESRYSQFGWRQLPRIGFDVREIEQQVQLCEVLFRMKPHERYVMMSQHFEAGSFDLKAKAMDRVRELGDGEADTVLAYDRIDERQHVRTSLRWIPALMEKYAVPGGDPAEWLGQSRARYAEIAAGLDDFHDLPVEQRLTGNKIKERFARSAC